MQYCVRDGDICKYDDARVTFDGSSEKDVNADIAYLEQHSDTVQTRLKMAGVRLGGILNALLGDPDEESISSGAPISLMSVASFRALGTTTIEVAVREETGGGMQQRIDDLLRARDLIDAELDRLRSDAK